MCEGVQAQTAGGAETVGETSETAAAGARVSRLTAAAAATRQETTDVPLQQEPREQQTSLG